MEVATEERNIILTKIDALLTLCGQRNLISSSELADALLDMRLAVTTNKDSDEGTQ